MTDLPELCEGWTWAVERYSETVDDADYPKIRVSLLLHDEVRRSAVIDVRLYGDGVAVRERAEAMAKSVHDEQMSMLFVSRGRP